MTSFAQLKTITLLAIIITVILSTFKLTLNNEYLTTSLSNTCTLKQSALNIGKMNHVCQQANMANNSWISWLSGDSKSTYLHFLDLVELVHNTLK